MTGSTPDLTPIEGGVTAAGGFRAAGVSCGLKKREKLDLALLLADDHPATAAGVFTTSQAVAAPVILCRDHLARSGGLVQAIAVNSGCANACTGPEGAVTARQMAAALADVAGCPTEQALVLSTGVIGQPLDLDKVTHGITAAASLLDRESHRAAAEAIMTTDLGPKEAAVTMRTPSGTFTIGGMAKGAGMIEPMMATMLAFVTTDAEVAAPRLQQALSHVVADTFNAITVDGECSTNDSVLLLASGATGVTIDDVLYPSFVAGLRHVCTTLAKAIVRGGEGATKLVAVHVTGAASKAEAMQAAKAIANSPLVKTAMHGGDPNWGRLVAVAGRAGVAFDSARCRVRIGPAVLFADQTVHAECEPDAAQHLAGEEIDLEVNLGVGEHDATTWTCDLSAEYVRINAHYRT